MRNGGGEGEGEDELRLMRGGFGIVLVSAAVWSVTCCVCTIRMLGPMSTAIIRIFSSVERW